MGTGRFIQWLGSGECDTILICDLPLPVFHRLLCGYGVCSECVSLVDDPLVEGRLEKVIHEFCRLCTRRFAIYRYSKVENVACGVEHRVESDLGCLL